jgi:quinol monooxygenase YgiN
MRPVFVEGLQFKEDVMFGSVFRMQVKSGKKQELLDLLADGSRVPPGMKAAYAFDTGGDEVWGVAVFSDEKAYRDNASSPEQNAEYQKMRALLAADPEWHDGTVTAMPV